MCLPSKKRSTGAICLGSFLTASTSSFNAWQTAFAQIGTSLEQKHFRLRSCAWWNTRRSSVIGHSHIIWALTKGTELKSRNLITVCTDLRSKAAPATGSVQPSLQGWASRQISISEPWDSLETLPRCSFFHATPWLTLSLRHPNIFPPEPFSPSQVGSVCMAFVTGTHVHLNKLRGRMQMNTGYPGYPGYV